MYRILVFTVFFLSALQVSSQNYITGKTPQRIILNLTDLPQHSIAVTWRTVEKPKSAFIQVARATNWTDFQKDAKTISATSKEIVTDKKYEVYQHSALISNLNPGALYVYRVGCDSVWSEWNQFKTAKASAEPFSFVYFGDPQNDIMMQCSRVFREAHKFAPNASFWLFTGDITSEPFDEQYQGFFDAGSHIFRTTPSILVPGNHDMGYKMNGTEFVLNEQGRRIRSEEVSYMFRDHFTLPENGLPGLEESTYYIDYQGVRFIMINSAIEKKLGEIAIWLDGVLSNNPSGWTVVSFHHPFYSAGKNRDEDNTRNAFGKLFDKYHVDLVLTGHDHAYSRSYKLVGGQKVRWNKKGTVYVISVSGPKMYETNSVYDSILAKTAVKTQLFQVISIDSKKLSYKSVTPVGEVIDSFILKKQ